MIDASEAESSERVVTGFAGCGAATGGSAAAWQKRRRKSLMGRDYHFEVLLVAQLLVQVGYVIQFSARINHHGRVECPPGNEPQQASLVRPEAEGGCGLDMLWNDDWHHSASVALTGRREAYYTDYRGTAQELLSMARLGFLYQGQRYAWQKALRKTEN